MRTLLSFLPPLWAVFAAAFLCSGVHSARPVEEGVVRRALLVGIEDYQGNDGWSRLRGARRDVHRFRRALVERAGFDESDIRVLLDAQATREGILAGFRAMAEASDEDDLILFYFAGHGSQVPDQVGKQADELDGLDETLIPWDYRGANGAPNDLRDDELRDLVRLANQRTPHVVLVFDCCSAGTNVRGEAATSRFVGPQARGLKGVRPGAKAAREDGSGYLRVGDELSYVSLAACRAHETAYEVSIPGVEGEEPQYQGLFTYSLVQEMYETTRESSYQDLVDRVRRRVREKQAQTPVVEGSLDLGLAFRGGLVTLPFSYDLDVENALLEGGLVNGLLPGAELDVFVDEASLEGESSPIGRVRLEHVEPTRSRFRWLEAPPERGGASSWRAALALPGTSSSRLRVSVQAPQGKERELVRALETSRWLELVPEALAGSAALGVRWEAVGDGARWRVCDRSGQPLPLGADVSRSGEVQDLVSRLERLGRAHVLEHDLVREEARLLDVRSSILLRGDDGEVLGSLPRDDAAVPLVGETQAIRCRFENRCGRPLFVSLVVFSPDGEVDVVRRPESPDEPVPPGGKIKIDLDMRVAPQDRPFYENELQSFRWFATTRFHDLRPLEQARATQSATRGAAQNDALEELDLWVTSTIGVRVLVNE